MKYLYFYLSTVSLKVVTIFMLTFLVCLPCNSFFVIISLYIFLWHYLDFQIISWVFVSIFKSLHVTHYSQHSSNIFSKNFFTLTWAISFFYSYLKALYLLFLYSHEWKKEQNVNVLPPKAFLTQPGISLKHFSHPTCSLCITETVTQLLTNKAQNQLRIAS